MLIHLAVLAILVEFYRVNPSLGTSVGFCIATVFNYTFQYHLTFKAKGSHSKIFIRYSIITLLMMGLNAIVFWCLTESWKIPYIYAQMLATIVIMFCNFTVNRCYTFKHDTVNLNTREGLILKTIKNQKLLLILLVAAILRFVVFLLFRPWNLDVQTESVLIGDAPEYHRLALCIVKQFSFCGNAFRTPGYPFFIAIFYMLFGAKPWIVLFAQIFTDLVAIYFVFKIGEMIFSKRIGIIAALLLAIDPNSIFSAASLYSESLFVAFLCAAIYFCLHGLIKDGRWRSFLIAGLLLALATLIKPVAQYYFVILLIFTVAWPTSTLFVRLRWGLIYGLAFAITISPWLYRNYTLYDSAKISSIQGENLLFWQVAYAKAWETHQDGEVVNAELIAQAKALGYTERADYSATSNPFANEKIAQKLAVEYITTHPKVYMSRWISGMIHTYTNLGTADIVKRLGLQPTYIPSNAMFAANSQLELVTNFFRMKSLAEIVAGFMVIVLLLVNYSALLMGTYSLIRQHQWPILVLFMASIGYFTITGGPIGLARFRLPIAPFYLLIGAVYIDVLIARRASLTDFQQRGAMLNTVD